MRKLLILISIVAASMFSTAQAATGDVTTIVDQTFIESPTLTDTDAYTWGKDIQGMITSNGVYVTNSSSTANNYENRDFITFTNPIGNATSEMGISYEVYSAKDKGQANTYYDINYFNAEGDFVFGIQEASGGWGYSANIITANTDGTTTTTAFPAGHMSKGGGTTVNVTVRFAEGLAIITIDGGSYNAYTNTEGIKALKLSVTGESGYDRDMYVKNFVIKTTEVAAAQFADYTLKYVCEGEAIDGKDDVTKSGEVGSSISLNPTETEDFKVGDIKYIFVSDDANGKTVDADGTTVVTLTYREAATYNYTVMSNVPTTIKTGTCLEGEKVTMAYSRYILAEDGTVWMKDASNKEYNYSFTPTSDNYVETLSYSATDIKDGIYFSEAEDIEGMTFTNGSNANIRCSNSAGAYANEPFDLYTLKPGTYKIKIGVWGGAGTDFIIKADNDTVAKATTTGSWFEQTSEDFTLKAETTLTFEGANGSHPLDYILITGIEQEPEDPVTRTSWDFTNWSEATVANIKAGSNWSDIEKATDTEPTAATKDNCYWQVSHAADLSPNKYIKANGVSIEELKGLVYTNETNDRSLAIAVNYPETSLGTYHGASYLWLGGGGINYFKIPGVPAGATIKMGIESHKPADARGVELSISGEVLNAPDGTTVEAPTTYVEQEWFVPVTADAINEVQIKNTNGCHIYFITVTPGAEVSGIAINDSEGNPVENLELKIGATCQLSAAITPDNAVNKTVTWKSSNEEIATVDQTGKVTSVAKGDVEITATSSNDKTATCIVTVIDAEIVVEEITLEQTEANINVGESLQLVAKATPAEASVSWTSDNEEIATVDEDGNVTAVAAGKAVITAQAGDKSASCTITVTVPVDGIALSFSQITVETGDEFTVGYTISPEDATDQTVTWTSDNEEVATVDENGKVTAIAAGEVKITAKAGEKEASCTIIVEASEVTDGAKVRMTYVDMDKPSTPIGIIKKGDTSRSGFNAISNGSVGFGNTGWGENKITYIQVDASAIKDNYITSAILTFEASGSTDSKRATGWGVGYNSSAWSSAMTYDSADKSITTIGDTQSTSTKASGTFETLSFDITEAINNAEGRIATILVYETAAAGGYIKNPIVDIVSTNELVYNVTFTETGGAEGLKVTVNDQDATNGMSLPNGTYSFTATATHCKDYTGEFTVADEDLNVEFAITPREKWSYTVNAVDANGEFLKELSNGEGYEDEDVTYYFPGYYLQGTTLLSKKHNSTNPYYGENAKLDSDGKVFEVKYDGTISDVVFYKEAEEMDDFTSRDTNNAPIRCSNGLGGTVDGEVLLTTLPAGTYIIHGQVWGTAGLTAGVKIKAASEEEEDTTLWILESTGSLVNNSSEEFILSSETNLYVYTTGGTDKRMLDYIYITGKVKVDVEGIAITDKDGNALEEIDLNADETYQLSAAVDPENATEKGVKWTSSDANVATVDENGLVTAVNGGSATITVTSAENDEITASVTVNVTVPVSDITLEQSEADMTMGNDLKLTATVAPENATGTTIEWASDNEEVATVDADGNVTALRVGKATISAACGGFTAECAVKVYPKVGDANWDGKITITDAVDITNYVVERKTADENWNATEWKEFYEMGANANADGKITFADASAAAELALEASNTTSTQSRIRAAYDDSMDALVIGRATATTRGTTVPVTLENSEAYVALQADIILPEGMNVEVKAVGRIAGSHSMMTRKHADNHIRVIFFNLANDVFADNDAPILEIVTDSYISASDIAISTILASDADANEYVLAARPADTTGIAAIGFDDNAPFKVFDVNGIYVSDTMEGLKQGIYIVRQGDNARKVHIR